MTIIRCNKTITEVEFDQLCQTNHVYLSRVTRDWHSVVIEFASRSTGKLVCGYQEVDGRQKFWRPVDQVVAQ